MKVNAHKFYVIISDSNENCMRSQCGLKLNKKVGL